MLHSPRQASWHCRALRTKENVSPPGSTHMVEGIGSPMGLTHPVIEDEGGRGELARQINTQILFK